MAWSPRHKPPCVPSTWKGPHVPWCSSAMRAPAWQCEQLLKHFDGSSALIDTRGGCTCTARPVYPFRVQHSKAQGRRSWHGRIPAWAHPTARSRPLGLLRCHSAPHPLRHRPPMTGGSSLWSAGKSAHPGSTPGWPTRRAGWCRPGSVPRWPGGWGPASWSAGAAPPCGHREGPAPS
jgi:hypothetical protein